MPTVPLGRFGGLKIIVGQVGVGVGVGVAVAVGVGVGVRVAVGVAVGVRVAVGVGVKVAVADAVAVGVGVGVPHGGSVKSSCRPDVRPPVLHSNCVDWLPVSRWTPTVALEPPWVTTP